MLTTCNIDQIDMLNTIAVNERLLVGGQPSRTDFELFQQLGIKTVINLRPLTESCDFDEAILAPKCGMQYHQLGIATENDFTRENVKQFASLLSSEEPILIHCASGNRVGAMFALKARWLDGVEANDALSYGKETGLTKLQPKIESLLGINGSV